MKRARKQGLLPIMRPYALSTKLSKPAFALLRVIYVFSLDNPMVNLLLLCAVLRLRCSTFERGCKSPSALPEQHDVCTLPVFAPETFRNSARCRQPDFEECGRQFWAALTRFGAYGQLEKLITGVETPPLHCLCLFLFPPQRGTELCTVQPHSCGTKV